MNALEKIQSLPATKEQQKEFAGQVLQKVLDGEVNPLHVKVWFKSISDALEMVDKDERFQKVLLDEASKYQAERQFPIMNAVCEIGSRSIYDFSDDKKWADLKEKIKERETLLKAVKPGNEIADTDTGEILTCKLRNVTQFIKIKF